MSENSGKDWIGILGEAGLFVGLCAIWLYVAGWQFAELYLLKFGINVSMIELKREYLITYGFWVFRDSSLVLGILAGIVVLFVWFIRNHTPALAPSVILFLVVAGTIATIALGSALGRSVAEDRFTSLQAGDYPSLRNLRLETKADWKKDNANLAERLADPMACFRLIFSDTKSVFVFSPKKNSASLPEVIQLSRTDIAALRIRSYSRSCAG